MQISLMKHKAKSSGSTEALFHLMESTSEIFKTLKEHYGSDDDSDIDDNDNNENDDDSSPLSGFEIISNEASSDIKFKTSNPINVISIA